MIPTSSGALPLCLMSYIFPTENSEAIKLTEKANSGQLFGKEAGPATSSMLKEMPGGRPMQITRPCQARKRGEASCKPTSKFIRTDESLSLRRPSPKSKEQRKA